MFLDLNNIFDLLYAFRVLNKICLNKPEANWSFDLNFDVCLIKSLKISLIIKIATSFCIIKNA